MSFLDKNGLQVLTNKLVQGDAIKVASHRGHTVKNVIDNITRECENVATPNTMTLENRVNEFKVGKGRDVDVSGDIEESKIEVELQGKTWQNLTGFGADFQTQHSSVFEKIDDEDSLSVKRVSDNDSGWAYWCNNKLKRTLIKPNTKYTLLFKFDSNKNYNLQVSLRDGSSRNPISNQINATRVFSNIYMAKLTTVSNFDGLGNGQVIYLHGGVPPKKGDWSRYYKDIILLEGDYTQTPIEELPKYFEGIKSSFEDGIVDVEVQGKNLVDLSKFNRVSNAVSQVNIVNNTISFSSSTRYNGVGQTFSEEEYKKMVGKYVTVSCGKITTSTGDSNDAYVFLKQSFVNNDGSATWNNSTIASGQSKKIKILEGVDLTRFGIFVEPSNPVSGSIDIKAENIQLEIDSASTSYEPYYKKKISFNIGEPLRSLPNGVCDEIRNSNGQWELARRVGKVVLDGSESWKTAIHNNKSRFDFDFKEIKSPSTWSDKTVPNMICSNLIVQPFNQIYSNGKSGINYYHANSDKLIVISLGNNCSLVEFKQWLSQNPTTVYYELAEPIITPIEPIEFEVKPLATMTINSEIAPISNHKVVLNRAGQIEQGIVQIAELKSRVDSLETAYDSNLLETQHKLSILGFEYELESEEI